MTRTDSSLNGNGIPTRLRSRAELLHDLRITESALKRSAVLGAVLVVVGYGLAMLSLAVTDTRGRPIVVGGPTLSARTHP